MSSDSPSAGTAASDPTWRDWHYGDEPCPYPGGCSEPWRSHYHYHDAPGVPVVVIYYDQPLLEQAHRIPEAKDA